ncbi:MAG TPA: hypothetical protein VGH28_27950 [Polyangiaceae bacterium]
MKLTEAETWDGEHLSEVALSCIADAQDVVDPVARVHAESCAECTLRIGALALESHEVGAALRVAKVMSIESKASHRFPTVMVAAAVVVAAVCGAPALLDAAPRALAWAFAAPHALPVVAMSFVAASKSLSGNGGAAVSLVATFALALIGFAVARTSRTPGVMS